MLLVCVLALDVAPLPAFAAPGAGPGQAPSFTSAVETSSSSSVTVGISTSVSLEGGDLEEGAFAFELTTQGGEVVAQANNDADGTVDFGELTFDVDALDQAVADGYALKEIDQSSDTLVWTLHYRAIEVTEDLPAGVSATKTSFDLAVIVTEGSDGSLSAAVVLPGDAGFSNVCSTSSVTVCLNGSVSLLADEGRFPDENTSIYKYMVEALDGAPAPTVTMATADDLGNVSLGTIEFTADLLEGVEPDEDGSRTKTFSYLITSEGETDATSIVDDASQTVEFTVTVDAEGNVSVARSDDVTFAFVLQYEGDAEERLAVESVVDSGATTSSSLNATVVAFLALDAVAVAACVVYEIRRRRKNH